MAYRVKHLGSKGWGLIAKQQVRQGSLVLEYIGDHDLLACMAAVMCMEPQRVLVSLYFGNMVVSFALHAITVCLQVIW